MNDAKLETVEQVRRFLEGNGVVEFRGLAVKEKYQWIEEVLIRFGYHLLRRDEKGVIRRYAAKVTGYSREIGGHHTNLASQYAYIAPERAVFEILRDESRQPRALEKGSGAGDCAHPFYLRWLEVPPPRPIQPDAPTVPWLYF